MPSVFIHSMCRAIEVKYKPAPTTQGSSLIASPPHSIYSNSISCPFLFFIWCCSVQRLVYGNDSTSYAVVIPHVWEKASCTGYNCAFTHAMSSGKIGNSTYSIILKAFNEEMNIFFVLKIENVDIFMVKRWGCYSWLERVQCYLFIWRCWYSILSI